MKKSLVALAVLVASGASFAQSSVTLYGVIDIFAGKTRVKDATGTDKQSVLNSDGITSSVWGMKGSEDLGGGLKANFQLEQEFDISTGAAVNNTVGTTNQTFNRVSWVGLSGDFGEVQLGKVWTAFDDVIGSSNAIFDSDALAPIYSVYFKIAGYSDHPVNGLRYTTPEFAGLTGTISQSLDENNPALAKVTSLALSYEAGPLALQLGYQKENITNTLLAPKDARFTLVGASYDFGVATAKFQYGRADNVDNQTGEDANEYQIGADIPVGDNIVVSLSYARSDDNKPAGAFEAKRDGYALAATYTLSKRSFLYTGYSYASESQNAARDNTGSALVVGMVHNF